MVSPEERRFDLALSKWYAPTLGTYALVYKHLLERLGVEATTGLWDALPSKPDGLMREILALETEPESDPTPAEDLDSYVRKLFASPVRGIDAAQASEFLRSRPPFAFIDAAFPEVRGVFSLTTYQSLHLFRDGIARIAEETIARFGKAGELMIYDALLSDPDAFGSMSAGEFMERRLARYQIPPETADIFSAGLDVELIRGNESEIVAHITRCDWACYFRERHPSVGYLLACSTDDPIYRQQCDGVRFQRRCTLMEDGPYCEFTFYRTGTE